MTLLIHVVNTGKNHNENNLDKYFRCIYLVNSDFGGGVCFNQAVRFFPLKKNTTGREFDPSPSQIAANGHLISVLDHDTEYYRFSWQLHSFQQKESA
jgi:hypothetical protein